MGNRAAGNRAVGNRAVGNSQLRAPQLVPCRGERRARRSRSGQEARGLQLRSDRVLARSAESYEEVDDGAGPPYRSISPSNERPQYNTFTATYGYKYSRTSLNSAASQM